MSVSEYQIELQELLAAHLNLEVSVEWRAKMNQGLYSPRVDVATGPYAIEDGLRYTDEHIQIFDQQHELFRNLTERHLNNLNILTAETNDEIREGLIHEKMERLRYTNLNGRCFLAIEIENMSSRKHLMGGAINCAVLGKIGIAVGYTQKMHNAFLNLYRYFEFLRNVEKPTFNTSNLLIISRDQLLEILH